MRKKLGELIFLRKRMKKNCVFSLFFFSFSLYFFFSLSTHTLGSFLSLYTQFGFFFRGLCHGHRGSRYPAAGSVTRQSWLSHRQPKSAKANSLSSGKHKIVALVYLQLNKKKAKAEGKKCHAKTMWSQ